MQHFLFLVFFCILATRRLASSRKNANLTTAEDLMPNVVAIKDLASKGRWPIKLSYIKTVDLICNELLLLADDVKKRTLYFFHFLLSIVFLS